MYYRYFFNLGYLLFTGLIEDPTESSNLANSVGDSDGVYFVPAFTGLGVNF